MIDNIAKLTKILLWVLIALTAFFAFMLFLNTSETDHKWISTALTFSEIVLYVTIAAAVLSALYIFTMKLIAKPKKASATLIPIFLLIIFLLIAFSTSSDEVLNMPTYEGSDNVPKTIKWTGTGIIIMYILLVLAVLSIVYVEISKLIKK